VPLIMLCLALATVSAIPFYTFARDFPTPPWEPPQVCAA